MPRYYDLEKGGHDPKITEGTSEDDVDRKTLKVIELSKEWGDRIPIGVFYQNETVPTYQDRIVGRIASYVERPPAKQPIGTKDGKSKWTFQTFHANCWSKPARRNRSDRDGWIISQGCE